jgi:hypothetical protein
MLFAILRQAWVGLLAILPRRLLAQLDGWARRHAERRAERRLAALRAARARQ